MIIVKMNDTTVECNIAAAELREIGISPEALVNGDTNTASFMAKLNQEMGLQLGYDPEKEVLMMSRNMMSDGNVRIYAVKMNNDDIQNSADRIKKAAEGIIDIMAQDNVDAIKGKSGKDKGQAMGEMVSKVSDMLGEVYLQEDEETKDQTPQSFVSKPVSDYSRYLAGFSELKNMVRFCRVVGNLPIEKSSLYKENDAYYLSLGLRTEDNAIVYILRSAGLEYADTLTVNSPEELHLEELGDCVIEDNALMELSGIEV